MLAWVMNMGFAASPSGTPPPVVGLQRVRRVSSIRDLYTSGLAGLAILLVRHLY